MDPSAPSADWPCSAVAFRVIASGDRPRLRIGWRGVRTRLNVSIFREDASGQLLVAEHQLLVGPWLDGFGGVQISEVRLPAQAGTFVVALRKLTEAAPFQLGIGHAILSPSVWAFHGVRVDGENRTQITHAPTPMRRQRSMRFIGASDTAGWCVDGTPSGRFLQGLSYYLDSNCEFAYTGTLGERLGAEVTVQALGGMGLTQNSMGERSSFIFGSEPMPYYLDRLLMTSPSTARPRGAASSEDLVVLSLGGCDFNNQRSQGGSVPSNVTFDAAYHRLLDELFAQVDGTEEDAGALRIASVCGMGSPAEPSFDPDNDRCRPCPHVQRAVESHRRRHPRRAHRLRYVFVPCNGSVVSGVGDIGCEGHKNRAGQAKVADHLEPHIRDLMAWT